MNNENEIGESYFCIKLTTQKDIYAFADQMEVANGALILRAADGQISFALAPNQWEYGYAASCTDGAPLAVEHWREARTQLPPHRKRDQTRYLPPVQVVAAKKPTDDKAIRRGSDPW